MSAVAPVGRCLFADQGYGGAAQERERRLAKRAAWLDARRKWREDELAQLKKLNKTLCWYQARGLLARAAEVQAEIDRRMAALKLAAVLR